MHFINELQETEVNTKRNSGTRWITPLLTGLTAVLVILGIAEGPRPASAQTATFNPAAPIARPLGSLKKVTVPKPQNLHRYLNTDARGQVTPAAREAAIALGKALFWDQAVGSDGLACASCHFNAGADSRTKNQLNPGGRAIPPDDTFTTPFTVNYQLHESDFPFHSADGTRDTNDIASSQGVHNGLFVDIVLGQSADLGTLVPNLFGAFRNVEPRNTPTMINAVFTLRNFWDGRARQEFNGVNPIGKLDPFARVLLNCSNPAAASLAACIGASGLSKVNLNSDPALRLNNSSLASQAVGPALSDFEMAFGGRTFAKLGKKMLSMPYALKDQAVAADDGVLGPYTSRSLSSGLNTNYTALIKAAFRPMWYNSGQVITIPGGNAADGTVALNIQSGPPPSLSETNRFTQMEYNFSIFWGLAIQMYESTLVADDSPMDKAFDWGDPKTFSSAQWGDSEKRGLDVFNGKGKCIACHGGPETTNASVKNVRQERLERMIMGNEQAAVYDDGFYNTAVRLCRALAGPCDDVGVGATIGPKNLPLSDSRFYQQKCKLGSIVAGEEEVALGAVAGRRYSGCVNAPLIAARPAEGIAFGLLQPHERVAVDGAFKTSGLRNIELTAPYFHNGGELTLMDVVNFYDRGGNFPGFNQENLDPNIVPLGLTAQEKQDLVNLMIAMTDDRVRYQKAPFDHPALSVENLPPLDAVGRGGSALPLNTFRQNLQ